MHARPMGERWPERGWMVESDGSPTVDIGGQSIESGRGRRMDAVRLRAGPDGTVGVLMTHRVHSTARLRHTVRFTDESTPTHRACPKGTLGAEVRLKLVALGQPTPTGPETLRFHFLCTDGSATAQFLADAGGKTAAYMLRWVDSGGAVGPWNEVCSATVAA
jgi:hypothetical protein